MTRTSFLSLAALLASAIPAHGHDLWLIPPDNAKEGKPALVRASVGMDFPKSVQAPDTDRYPRRFAIQPDGKQIDVKSAGKEELVSLLRFDPTQPGVHVLAVETTPKIIELPADRFNEYLVTDGLPHIFRLRANEKILDKPGIERYRKSPKALIAVGDSKKGAWDKVLGLPLEIVPMQNPFLVKAGDTLRVKVLFQEKPLGQANLGWHRPGDGDTPGGTVRTNAKGEALIPISESGLITIRLTHMTRPKAADHEWESFWTTLTWRIP